MPSNRFLIRTEQYKRGTNTLNIFEKQIHVVHFSGKSIRTLKLTPAIGSPLQSRGDGTALLNAVVKRAVQ